MPIRGTFLRLIHKNRIIFLKSLHAAACIWLWVDKISSPFSHVPKILSKIYSINQFTHISYVELCLLALCDNYSLLSVRLVLLDFPRY